MPRASAALSAPSVSRAVTALLRSGLVEEIAEPRPTGGRPATHLQLARDGAQVIGIAVDADRCCVVSAGLDGKLHDDTVEVRTPATYPALITSLERASEALEGKTGTVLKQD